MRISFNNNWHTRPKVNPFAELAGAVVDYRAVTLPHDAMIEQQRVTPSGETTMAAGAGAYFPGGAFEYRKQFFVPQDCNGKRVIIEFEGVYRDATVRINGAWVGQRPYGYSQFQIIADPFLRFGQDNEIHVDVRAHRDSRWYSGAGIYRDTWMHVTDMVRIATHGVHVTTPEIEAERAVAEVATTLANDTTAMHTVDLAIRVRDAWGNLVAETASPVTVLPGEPAIARQRLYITDPALWGPDSPHLYTAEVTMTNPVGGTSSETVRFGVRSLQLDPEHGLRLNGKQLKLRGACIHHDNGPIGAVTIAAAEHRRVRILKDAGFNAIRMSHNPMSTAMLDACDRLGMLVVDEAFDMWTGGKNEYDYSLAFPEWWQRDLEAMVAKDINHPSVIMYSIGNEIPEAGSPMGAVWGRRLAEKVRSLDGTRYVTNAINPVLTVMDELRAMRRQAGEAIDEGAGINTFMADLSQLMAAISTSELVSDRTAESFAVLDVAGMNYADGRYVLDRDLFPNRIILGTETFPTHIDVNWQLVTENPHVIGDFTWTGWDYLGEVGLGRPIYLSADKPQPTHSAPYPQLVAGCGDIDITGQRKPASYYREIVFGLRTDPYLAVERPHHHGHTFAGSRWAWRDCLSSWTWPGFENSPITVETYSAADEVELILNGTSIGRKPAGPQHQYRTEFETTYQAGELVAIAYTADVETGRATLRSATGDPHLRATTETTTLTIADGDLAYVDVTLVDVSGTRYTGVDRPVTLEVSGAGDVLGFASADPATEERFDAPVRHTYDGHVLAVLRPTGAGEIRLVASAENCSDAEIRITVIE